MNKKIPFPVFYSKQEQRYAAAAGIQNAPFTKGGGMPRIAFCSLFRLF
ncbi:hypothetical protein MKC55_02255 [[Clostridium] innocuum]|uniref:Uncharacterized protein n=1 Tax=Clostridium innocuum TaxID=1522 RepID=A0AB36BBZ2_CLOIN|nr:hypothetical protein [[Clostridium] innocuum]MCI2982785.1 hypothetical protein [[Clostridium] innocuum]MCR0168007.1 hypothetical protein [[Clostridium] innocuum]MCR0195943.1 hypothetical protein [[Clostridium] innocuum]MCR0219375.1 hypothetical protein [[Clostridium] innocuum]MCR0435758.1 hypothetical protein [[Clostridium] innocuum]